MQEAANARVRVFREVVPLLTERWRRCPLTLGGKLLQVLQRDLFVAGAVGQTVIDHRVLGGHAHKAVSSARRKTGA